ncbi:hypothetical protein M1N42_03860 [Thermodesulfovibrionales bacterium]|nr:hypothetical protein [Thermodesulfovibrionales bacterium]MCL0068858.1 hypothetical protein [Thermodesulfovibrionales bacterium]
MASPVKKKISGHIYLLCKRIQTDRWKDQDCRQKYLGKAIDELEEINEVVMLKYLTSGKSTALQIKISKMTPEQQEMFTALNLSCYSEAIF